MHPELKQGTLNCSLLSIGQNSVLSLKVIVHHPLGDEPIKCSDKKFINCERQITIIGWELQHEMSDGTTQWLSLKDVKESNPVETAKYAVATRLA